MIERRFAFADFTLRADSLEFLPLSSLWSI